MIYGLSLLFLLLSLVLLIPAIRQIVFMLDVKKNSAMTTGNVLSSKSATGWLWMAEFGNQDRPLIRYQPTQNNEMILEVTTSSFLPQRRYEPGQAVEVIYDRNRPGRAFPSQEWKAALGDIWFGSGTLIIAIALWVVGRVYSLPF